jgi:hypothetical protein
MWDNALPYCAEFVNILLSPFSDESIGQRNDPTSAGMTTDAHSGVPGSSCAKTS